MTDTAALATRLELAVRSVTDGLAGGEHRRPGRGLGVEAIGSRPLQPGDAASDIDWPVTARSQGPWVRERADDRDVRLTFMLDGSSSLALGTTGTTKHELATTAIGALAVLVARRGGRIGGAIAAGERLRWLPQGAGREHVTHLIRQLAAPPPEGVSVELATALRVLGAGLAERGVVLIATDLLDRGPWAAPLAALARRQDVVVIETIDPIEIALPNIGYVLVRDLETGRRRRVDTEISETRHRYRALAAERRRRAARLVRSAGADHLALRTDRAWLADLRRFLVVRNAR